MNGSSFTNTGRRITKRERFLNSMDKIVPWAHWTAEIEKQNGKWQADTETMLRLYLMQRWFHLSDDEAVDAAYDSFAMQKFLGGGEAFVPEAKELAKFRRSIEKVGISEAMIGSIDALLAETDLQLLGGRISDASVFKK